MATDSNDNMKKECSNSHSVDDVLPLMQQHGNKNAEHGQSQDHKHGPGYCLVFVERLQPSHSLWTGEAAMSALPCWLWV